MLPILRIGSEMLELGAASEPYSNISLPMRRKNVLKAYICTFHLRMRGPWYATKRLFASFATATFQKICRGPAWPKA